MHRKEKILVVDDSVDMLEVIERSLKAAGYPVIPVPGVSEAVRAMDATSVDLVITDLRMPGGSGMDLLRHVRENLRNTEVIVVTGYASVPGAVEAMATGAHEYLGKPFTDEELLGAVRRALAKVRLRRTDDPAARPSAPAAWGILGDSAAMQTVYRSVEKAAHSGATILVCGESGTGKELVARAIHYRSARRTAPFVPVNCGAIPDALLESEFFGHCKGAFTGAHEARTGFFQAADGGTIFLDEVAELTSTMQVALLRVLQDKVVFRVGSREPRKVDARVIAATNRRLEDLVLRGEFRQDLFYRINVVPIELPPLRDRGEDIPMLLHHFTRRVAAELGKPPPVYSDRALKVLRDYPWPGNVRELENMVQRIVLMAESDLIDTPDLPSLMRFSAHRGAETLRTLAKVEADHIRAVLESVDGNKSRAAAILGIDRKTLREKLKPRR